LVKKVNKLQYYAYTRPDTIKWHFWNVRGDPASKWRPF